MRWKGNMRGEIVPGRLASSLIVSSRSCPGTRALLTEVASAMFESGRSLWIDSHPVTGGPLWIGGDAMTGLIVDSTQATTLFVSGSALRLELLRWVGLRRLCGWSITRPIG